MTNEFYARSQFMRPVNKSKLTSCHPSAINMFSGNDFRIEVSFFECLTVSPGPHLERLEENPTFHGLHLLQMCGDQSEETFFTIHHEMGHVQYYMNYAQLPTIFRVR